jgi:Tfp pilus assembly protein PilN
LIEALNLASDPFRNRVLPWTITAVVACASLVALFWIVSEHRAAATEIERANRELVEAREQTREIREHAEALKREMPPNDLQTLMAAHLLIDRKGFAWSNLFADLEAAVPQGVRVTRISVRDVVEVAPDTKIADLALTVVGRTPSDVTGMIGEMNRVGIFNATPLTEDVQKGQGESGFEWTLRVSYRPRSSRPATVVEPAADAAAASVTPTPDNPVVAISRNTGLQTPGRETR